MASEQLRAVRIEIGQDLAQALWATMQDDDDLAYDAAERGVFHVIDKVVSELPCHTWRPEQYEKIVLHMAEAKIRLDRRGWEMAQRFHRYCEPPF